MKIIGKTKSLNIDYIKIGKWKKIIKMADDKFFEKGDKREISLIKGKDFVSIPQKNIFITNVAT